MKNIAVLFLFITFVSCASAGSGTTDWGADKRPEVSTALDTNIPEKSVDENRLHEPEIAGKLKRTAEMRQTGNYGLFALRVAEKILTARIKDKKESIARVQPKPAEKIIPRKTEPAPVATKTHTEPSMPVPETPVKKSVSEELLPVSIEPTDPSESIRTIYAKKKDDIEVSFPENGWLLLSVPQKADGLEYLSHSNNEKQTVFYFRGHSEGDFLLPFQLQDSMRGLFKNESIMISIVSDDEFTSIMGRKKSGDAVSSNDAIEEAFRLREQGQTDAALDGFLNAYREGDPRLNNAIASIYFQKNNFPQALLYWRKNQGADEPYNTNAVIGISKALRLSKNTAQLLPHVKVVLLNRNGPIENELLELIRYFSNFNEDPVLIDLFGVWLDRYRFSPEAAEIYYRLAKFFENNIQYRDFQRSREYYNVVVQEYPGSRYAMLSRERIDYINRHYIKVR
ncbi:MAG: hypothetical protein JW904_09830 [Spirochaetales bacterium]|nr:hypothetical protein [Spirochaetales bacterium]